MNTVSYEVEYVHKGGDDLKHVRYRGPIRLKVAVLLHLYTWCVHACVCVCMRVCECVCVCDKEG